MMFWSTWYKIIPEGSRASFAQPWSKTARKFLLHYHYHTVFTKTIGVRFQLDPLSRAFSRWCGFAENTQRFSVDRRPERVEMCAVSNLREIRDKEFRYISNIHKFRYISNMFKLFFKKCNLYQTFWSKEGTFASLQQQQQLIYSRRVQKGRNLQILK